MRIAHSSILRYAVPFTAPMRLTGRNLAQREGLVVILFGSSGRMGVGEIAPLPGLHRELLEEALLQLRTTLALLRQQPLPNTFSPLDGVYCLPGDLYPSVRTGLEMALLNLFAVESLVQLPDLPGCGGRAAVRLNGLVSGTVGDMEEQAERLLAEGYRTLKLKVGRLELRQEIAMVRFVRSIVGSGIELRLDANRSWALDTAVEFGKAITDADISYIEEPLFNAAQLPDFVRATGIRIALDESLAAGNPMPALDPSVVAALVIKPSVVGGLAQSIELIRCAQQHGVISVLSSAFETGVSLGMYAWLASTANTADVACGLDTYKALQHDIISPPFSAEHGLVEVRTAWLNSSFLVREYIEPA